MKISYKLGMEINLIVVISSMVLILLFYGIGIIPIMIGIYNLPIFIVSIVGILSILVLFFVWVFILFRGVKEFEKEEGVSENGDD